VTRPNQLVLGSKLHDSKKYLHDTSLGSRADPFVMFFRPQGQGRGGAIDLLRRAASPIGTKPTDFGPQTGPDVPVPAHGLLSSLRWGIAPVEPAAVSPGSVVGVIGIVIVARLSC
jgi:hypothetical protein